MRLPLIVLTILHLLVDGICGASLANYAINESRMEPILFHFTFYTVLAFGFQGPVGFIVDHYAKKIRWFLIFSVVLLTFGAVSSLGIFTQVILLGLGNCLFHVVGGAYVLCKYEDYTELGFFVASGALGLGLGLNSMVGAFSFVLGAILCVTVAFFCIEPIICKTAYKFGNNFNIDNSTLLFCVTILLLCIVLRSFGSNGDVSTENVMLLPFIFAVGKLLGGVVCDAIGYKATVFFIFILEFISLQLQGLLSGILFILTCNMTMPLTLRLVHWCKMDSPGLMFGLAATCLVPGVIWKGIISIPPQQIVTVQFIFLAMAGFILFEQRSKYA